MYRVELYAAVRRSVYVEGWSERAAGRCCAVRKLTRNVPYPQTR